MTKKLLTQIKNEWLSNLWLVLELLVVSVVMWYVVDYLYTRAATYLEPRGFNIEHCYLIELGELTPKSPDYIAGHTSQQTHDDIAELLERLRRRPEIEAVSLSQNSYPYNGSNSGAEVSYDTLRSPGWTIRRLVTPDFPRVFRYRGTRGETPEQLAEMLERGEVFGVLQARDAAGGLDLLAVGHVGGHEGDILAGRAAASKARGGLDIVGVGVGDDLAELDLLFVGEQAGLDDDL